MITQKRWILEQYSRVDPALYHEREKIIYNAINSFSLALFVYVVRISCSLSRILDNDFVFSSLPLGPISLSNCQTLTIAEQLRLRLM